MRLNKLTDYAVLTMIPLAQAWPEGGPLSARALADLVNVSLPTVSKILKILSHADLVISTRGITGGYRLSREASQISVAQILEAIEGPMALTDCVNGAENDCSVQSVCWMRGHWDPVNAAVSQALSEVSLADMIPKPFAFEPSYQERLIAAQERTRR